MNLGIHFVPIVCCFPDFYCPDILSIPCVHTTVVPMLLGFVYVCPLFHCTTTTTRVPLIRSREDSVTPHLHTLAFLLELGEDESCSGGCNLAPRCSHCRPRVQADVEMPVYKGNI